MYINIQPEKIFYKKVGTGNNNFILLHNAGGNHLFFTHQIKLLKINLNTLTILTDEHHCSYRKLTSIKNNMITLAKVVGSKCWATLEVPEQINAMISRFLSI